MNAFQIAVSDIKEYTYRLIDDEITLRDYISTLGYIVVDLVKSALKK